MMAATHYATYKQKGIYFGSMVSVLPSILYVRGSTSDSLGCEGVITSLRLGFLQGSVPPLPPPGP